MPEPAMNDFHRKRAEVCCAPERFAKYALTHRYWAECAIESQTGAKARLIVSCEVSRTRVTGTTENKA